MSSPEKILGINVVPEMAKNVQEMIKAFAEKIGIEYAGKIKTPSTQYTVGTTVESRVENALTVSAGDYLVFYSANLRVISNPTGTTVQPILTYSSTYTAPGSIILPTGLTPSTFSNYNAMSMTTLANSRNLGLGIKQTSSTADVTATLVSALIFRLTAAN